MREALQLFGDWNHQVATWFYNINGLILYYRTNDNAPIYISLSRMA
jgi:hypothetical protein